ncbi:hypothetical protein LTR53_008882, partial [Teratosphaeriaceae sp. CCFEE 6253]
MQALDQTSIASGSINNNVDHWNSLGVPPTGHGSSSLQYRKYGYMDLANLVVAWLRQPPLAQSQRWWDALLAFHSWWASWPGPQAGESHMQALLSILSTIFFLDELREVRFSWRADLLRDHGAYGRTSLDPTRPGLVHIKLDPTDWSGRMSGAPYKIGLLGTMLHECAHAFLMLYADQRCSACTEDQGQCGHGPAWVMLAANMEAFARGTFGLDVRLGAFTMLPRYYVPSAEFWEAYYAGDSPDWSFRLSWPLEPDRDRRFTDVMLASIRKDPRIMEIVYEAA